MTQDKVLIRRSGHQQLDELEATDIPTLPYEASGAVATHAAASDPHPTYTTAAEMAAYAQPLDSDLSAIAALSTTSFGRAVLALADAAALRTAAAVVIGTDVEAHDADLTTFAGLSPSNDDLLQRKAGAWANRTIAQLLTDLAAAGTTFQPLDSDLTAIAALTTTTTGRSLLAAANAAAIQSIAGTVIGTNVQAWDADLDAVAALSPTNNDVLQRKSGAWANRTLAQLMTDLAALGTTFQPLDADLTAIAGLTSAANKLPYFAGAGAAALADLTAYVRTLLDDADASTARGTLGLSFAHITGGTKFYPCSCSSVTNNQADTLNVLFAVPFWAPTSTAYDRIMVTVGGAVANATGRIGIYNDAGGKPGTLLVDAGSFGAAALAATGDKTVTINQTLSGLYWLAFVGQTAAPNLVHATANGGFINLGTTSGFSTAAVAAYSQTGVSGALPSPWGSTFTDNVRTPIIYLRAT